MTKEDALKRVRGYLTSALPADAANEIEEIMEALTQAHALDQIRSELTDTGAYEQEVNGKTEYLDGINYCLHMIDVYRTDLEEKEK